MRYFLLCLMAYSCACAETLEQFRDELLKQPILLVRRKANNPALPANWNNLQGLNRKNLENEIVLFQNGQIKTLVKPRGTNDYLGDLQLHWDAKRLMFTSNNAKGAYRIYETNLDSPADFKEMVQIEEPDVDNYSGCWLADDAVLFLSTATMIGVPCVRGSSHIGHIYRQDADGIRRLTFDQEHNWYPTLLADGRVMYLRWEYSDIPHFCARILFTMNPDGSAQREYYGSNSYWPNALFYAKPLPDKPGQFAAIVSGHHGVPRMGELIVFDPSKGRFEADGVVQRIPGKGKKVEPRIEDGLADGSWPKFLTPTPLGNGRFIAAMKPSPSEPWGLYLVDMDDHILPLLVDKEYMFLEPTLVQPRPRPPVLPSQIAKGKPGYIKLIDIYAGPGLAGVPRGTIKSLRISTYAFSYRGMGGQVDRVGLDGPWDVRRILGTVPVEKDGSAYFEIPANTPISIQPLDEKGRAVQLMRSWVMSMPGEMQTCVGCHEPINSAATSHRVEAVTRNPVKIAPWYGPARGFSFNREVQPVLDKYCIGCHNGSDKEIPNFTRRPDLLDQGNGGYKVAHFPPAYLDLKRYVRNHTIESDMHLLLPYEFHASNTDLVRKLEAGHKGIRLDTESWDRINTWIDLNTPAHGTWTEIAGESHVKGVAARRRELFNRYAGFDEDPEDTDYRAVEHKPALDGKPVKNDRPDMVKVKPANISGILVSPKEVTNAEFREFDPTHDSRHEVGDFLQFSEEQRGAPVNGPDQPVVRVSWEQAKAYCAWLSKKRGSTFRLPTAAERLTVAIGNKPSAIRENLADAAFREIKSYKPWGAPKSTVLPWRNADTNRNDGFRATAPVASFAPDQNGLYDVAGNVREWTGTLDDAGRPIAMGCSFATHPKDVSPFAAVSYLPWQRVYDVGFRVVEEKK